MSEYLIHTGHWARLARTAILVVGAVGLQAIIIDVSSSVALAGLAGVLCFWVVIDILVAGWRILKRMLEHRTARRAVAGRTAIRGAMVSFVAALLPVLAFAICWMVDVGDVVFIYRHESQLLASVQGRSAAFDRVTQAGGCSLIRAANWGVNDSYWVIYCGEGELSFGCFSDLFPRQGDELVRAYREVRHVYGMWYTLVY